MAALSRLTQTGFGDRMRENLTGSLADKTAAKEKIKGELAEAG